MKKIILILVGILIGAGYHYRVELREMFEKFTKNHSLTSEQPRENAPKAVKVHSETQLPNGYHSPAHYVNKAKALEKKLPKQEDF